MRNNNVELLVYIKGRKPAIEYTSPRDLQKYIEGRDGSEFEIEIVNHNNFRIEAVVSVDSLSVIDGKIAGDDSRGYLVDANSRVRIPGWVVDSGTAAKFEFSGRKGGSYVEQSTGEPTNKGVIGLLAFKEVYSYSRPVKLGRMRSTTFGSASRGVMQDNVFGDNYLSGSGISWSDNMSYNGASSASLSASSASCHAGDASMDWMEQEQTRGITPEVKQTLGTGFGDSTDFATQKVNFNRGDMLVLMALYYDDRRGLEKRGIKLTRPSQARYETAPNPFPNRTEGCVPPRDWKG